MSSNFPADPATSPAAGAEPSPADTAAGPAAETAASLDAAAEAPANDATPTGTPASTLSPEACAQELKTRFPALFRGDPKPLKLRIQADIQQRAPGVFTKAALSAFLRRFTGSTRYLIALTHATQRFDLDGAPAGELTAEHKQAAQEELTRRRQIRNEREAQAVQERRNRAQLLRDFETNKLTVANFCALKGVAPEALDPLLAQARAEREEDRARPRDPASAPREGRPGPRGEGRAPGPREGRRDERGGRPGAPASRGVGRRGPKTGG